MASDYLIVHTIECKCSTCLPKPPTRSEWNELVARVEALEKAVQYPGLYSVGP